MPTPTATPEFRSPEPDVFVEMFVPLVALAVGFSAGMGGKGEVIGLPVVELPGGAGGDITGGDDVVEGTDGGGDGNVDVGGGLLD